MQSYNYNNQKNIQPGNYITGPNISHFRPTSKTENTHNHQNYYPETQNLNLNSNLVNTKTQQNNSNKLRTNYTDTQLLQNNINTYHRQVHAPPQSQNSANPLNINIDTQCHDSGIHSGG